MLWKRIQETMTLSTNGMQRGASIGKEEEKYFSYFFAVEVLLKCRWSAVEVSTAAPTHLPLLTPSLSKVGWSKTVIFMNLEKKDPKVKKESPFFYSVITEQLLEYILWPEVSSTPGSNIFHGEGTYFQQHTDKHRNLCWINGFWVGRMHFPRYK